MNETKKKKSALTIMIIILVILGLSAGGIGYYLYTIQDVTPQESSAYQLDTSNLCAETIVLQPNETDPSETGTKEYNYGYSITQEGNKQTKSLDSNSKITLVSVFEPIDDPRSSQTKYTTADFTINGKEVTSSIVDFDSLDEDQRTSIQNFYKSKGITVADLSQKKYAIQLADNISSTINVVTKGNISVTGGTKDSASCGAIFTTTDGGELTAEMDCEGKGDFWCSDTNTCAGEVGLCPESPGGCIATQKWCDYSSECIPLDVVCLAPPLQACTGDAKVCDDGTAVGRDHDNNCEFFACPIPIDNIDENGCITNGILPELWCENIQSCEQIEDIGLCPEEAPDLDEHGCQTESQDWCAESQSCIPTGETCDVVDPDDGGETPTTSNVSVTIAGSTTCLERVTPDDTTSITITIKNNDTDEEEIDKIVNKLPLGFIYTADSTLINGATESDDILTIETTGSTQELTWEPATNWTLLADQSMTLRLTAVAGESALTGANQNEVVITPINTPLDATTLRATYVINVEQSCTSPQTGIFDTAIGRIFASMMLIVASVAFYKSNSSQQVSANIINSKAVDGLNTGFRLFGLRLTHPRKFFEEKFESEQKKK
jgi:hypothetical protein